MRAIELFAGAGGLAMGVCRAGFKPVAVVEWDRYCRDTIEENREHGTDLIANWPKEIFGDIRTVQFRDFEGKVDLITGGPPCQPFSLGGKHNGNADKRDMFPEAVRAVREARPTAFIFENVKGLTRTVFANYYEYIFLQLTYPEILPYMNEDWFEHFSRLQRHHTSSKRSEPHYNVVRHLVNAANYGIPQRRERVFFVGFRSDLGIEWEFPEETHSLDALIWNKCVSGEYWDRHEVAKPQRKCADRLLSRAKRLERQPEKRDPWRTVRDALAGLPDPECGISNNGIFNHRFQPGARSYPGHTGSPLDEPAKTLKAGVHGVPGGENMMLYPDGRVRYFTVREAARLQTFPEDFRFHGSWSETMRQLGNAVPVELSHLVAKSVWESMETNSRVKVDGRRIR